MRLSPRAAGYSYAALVLAVFAGGLLPAMNRHFQVDELQNVFNIHLLNVADGSGYLNNFKPYMVPLSWITAGWDDSASIDPAFLFRLLLHLHWQPGADCGNAAVLPQHGGPRARVCHGCRCDSAVAIRLRGSTRRSDVDGLPRHVRRDATHRRRQGARSPRRHCRTARTALVGRGRVRDGPDHHLLVQGHSVRRAVCASPRRGAVRRLVAIQWAILPSSCVHLCVRHRRRGGPHARGRRALRPLGRLRWRSRGIPRPARSGDGAFRGYAGTRPGAEVPPA